MTLIHVDYEGRRAVHGAKQTGYRPVQRTPDLKEQRFFLLGFAKWNLASPTAHLQTARIQLFAGELDAAVLCRCNGIQG